VNTAGQAPLSTAALVDVKLLVLFDVLYTTHSVTRCAEELGLSQPTASLWLSQLRRAMRDPLFVRSPKGMMPTRRADELITVVRSTLGSIRQLSSGWTAFSPSESDRTFRIHMTDGSHITLLPRLYRAISAAAPSIRLEVASIEEGTAEELRTGNADLALGFVPWLEGGFYHQALYRQRWCCLVRRGHPRIHGSLAVTDYSREGHVLVVRGTGDDLVADTLTALSLERRTPIMIPGVLGLPTILSESDLVATLPRHIGETLAASADLVVVPCPIPVPDMVIQQYWHMRHHQDPAHQWLRQTVLDLFGSMDLST